MLHAQKNSGKRSAVVIHRYLVWVVDGEVVVTHQVSL